MGHTAFVDAGTVVVVATPVRACSGDGYVGRAPSAGEEHVVRAARGSGHDLRRSMGKSTRGRFAHPTAPSRIACGSARRRVERAVGGTA